MIKAIQTEYNQLLFRSRIEARWAYTFDLLSLPYEYEKEGYDLPSGRYLPDFWMPTLKKWVEIKGESPDKHEEKLAYELADATDSPVVLLFGTIPTGIDPGGSGYVYFPHEGWDAGYALCECPKCGLVGIEFDGRSDRLPCKFAGCPRYSPNGDKMYTGESDRVLQAYLLARQARFEHGETPPRRHLQFRPYAPKRTYDEMEAEWKANPANSRELANVVNFDDIPW